jgi:5'-methylthioadenosine phosphorylase
MTVGIITGSGAYALADLADAEPVTVPTPYGEVPVTRGLLAGVEVAHISRHGPHHERLSNVVNYRGNVWALRSLGVDAVIGTTACGAVDASLSLGSLIVFDDLYFIANRLPDGSLCTFYDQPADPARGHWLLHGGPFSERLASILGTAALSLPVESQVGGIYGHVDGPRFNTPAEIAALAACGVAAVSQTGGPETVLCGELQLPFALVGFLTDYANEVRPGETTPVAELLDHVREAPEAFAELLEAALPRVQAAIDAGDLEPAGTLHQF